MIKNFKKNLNSHASVIKSLNKLFLLKKIERLAKNIIDTYKNNGKVIFAGNGGSFSDCLHLSAELTGRFKFDRAPLHSLVLGSNPSSMTAISNDYNYNIVFKRELEAIADPKADLLICLSTSGNSKNILSAMDYAKKNFINSYVFCGKTQSRLGKNENSIIIPSKDTARIQEAYLLIGHMVIEEVEKNIFKDEK